MLAMLQQQSSLQQPQKSGWDGVIDRFGKGAEKSLKIEDQIGGSKKSDLADKVLQKLGLAEAPAGPITDSLSSVTLDNAPSFSLEAPAYDIGFTPPVSTPVSVVPDAGASIIPDSLPGSLTPGDFSLNTGNDVLATQPGMFSMEGLGSAGNALLPAAGALGGINLAISQGDAPSGGGRNMRGLLQGGASGAALGSYFGPPGAIIGGGIGALGGLAGSLFGSSKGGMQMTRDEWRDSLKGKLFDDNYQGTLADNSTFDFGKDKFGFGTGEEEIDLSKPAVGRAAAWGNALAGITGYGGGKDKEAVSAQFTKASTANLKDPNDINSVRDNYKHFLSKLGITNKDDAHRYLDESSRQGMDQQTWGMGTSAIDEIFGNSAQGFDKNGKWVG